MANGNAQGTSPVVVLLAACGFCVLCCSCMSSLSAVFAPPQPVKDQPKAA